MEIEAKFIVPDRETFDRLQAAPALAGFAVGPGKDKPVQDTYLDTPARQVLAAGYALRQRRQPDGILYTLKGLGGAGGAIHLREEVEVLASAESPPSNWPPGPARDLALRLVGALPLDPLFSIKQMRVVRPVTREGRQVAEMSLDDVHAEAGGRQDRYFEVEVELKGGTLDDLTALAECLRDEWKLAPQARSKFERALNLSNGTP